MPTSPATRPRARTATSTSTRPTRGSARRSEPGQERQRLEQDRRHAFVDVHRRRLGCRRRHRLQDDHDPGDGPTGGRDLCRPRRQHGLEHERRRQHRQDRPGDQLDGQSPAKNANGWNKTDVTLSWTCTDGGSGVVAGTVSKTITTQGTGQQEAGTCADLAGNTASSTNGDVNIDKTDPGISFDGRARPRTPTAGTRPTSRFRGRAPTAARVSSPAPSPRRSRPRGRANRRPGLVPTSPATRPGARTATSTSTRPTRGSASTVRARPRTPTAGTRPTSRFRGRAPTAVGCRRRHRLQDDHDPGDGPTGGRDLCRPRRQHGLEHNGDVNIDKTDPVASVLSVKKADNWPTHRARGQSSVTVDFACTDALSGVASLTPDPFTFSGSGADQVASTTCTDNAGNSNGASQGNTT